jgi:pimeloyl-ACP methyl ester carboxylesterase
MRITSTICTSIVLAVSLPATFAAPLLDLSLSLGYGGGSSYGPSKGGRARCVTGSVNINATTKQNIRFNFPIPDNQTVVTNTFLQFITPGNAFLNGITVNEQTVGGTWTIGATLCVPSDGTVPIGVQLATHGVGFDRTYWDFAPGYSYADVAAKYGYATFFYDRLGIGASSKPDAIQTVQAPLEAEILHQLVLLLRGNGFLGRTFSKVVGVGHSFGSILSQAVAAQHPEDFDGLVLTGFGIDSSGVPAFIASQNFEIASQNQPFRFTGLSNGYVVAASSTSVQYGFFRFPNYDPSIFDASVATKATATLGEFFSLTAVSGVAKEYTRPVAVVNGLNDFPFCQNNCSAPVDQAAAVFPALFPAVPADRQFSYLVPGVGHGLNLHYPAASVFVKIQEFLKGWA